MEVTSAERALANIKLQLEKRQGTRNGTIEESTTDNNILAKSFGLSHYVFMYVIPAKSFVVLC